jgi:hypothetical protein
MVYEIGGIDCLGQRDRGGLGLDPDGLGRSSFFANLIASPSKAGAMVLKAHHIVGSCVAQDFGTGRDPSTF